ncbi:receptor-like protein Cf-9 [Humulus lupulus]|uniref:receptor-like protein Cf-9 n=1 Tax=Humulus lupulus TaxID=3486 RepID=UPI002B408462|nr:receptor-like protein Cf-9 [Humulus lupulus]
MMGSSVSCFIFSSFLYNLIYILVFLNLLLCFSFSQPSCHDDERTSLLQFKENFIISKSASRRSTSAYPKVSSWTHEAETRNCCLWDGVECDEKTGHVIGLDLSSSFLYGTIDSNSTLFNLLHLQRLNLSDNHFNYSQIPTAVKRLSMLTSLWLFDSVFSGQIPSEVSELSKLSALYLCRNVDPFSGENLLELKNPNLESFISNLTSLEVLCLSQVYISSTLPKSLANLTSLTKLYLRDCELKGEFPVNIFQLPKLQELSVRFNKDLSGRFPVVLNERSSLKKLLLSGTSFSSELPFEKLASLSVLVVSGCNFSGVIPISIGKMKQLTILSLSENKFSGQISSYLSNLTQLNYLYLHSNHFSGPFPMPIFSKLVNLELLSIAYNNWIGTVEFDMFKGLTNLNVISLSDLKLSLPHINETFPQLRELDLVHCNLRKFPEFLRHQKRMESLTLEGNHIGGGIPEWLQNINRETLRILSLSTNSLTGELSPTTCKLSSLIVLDLSHNMLVGKLPNCFGRFSKSLSSLILTNNSFSGNIPKFTERNQLKHIDLSYNLFEGKLSHSLTNCKMLGHLNVGSNELNDVFPYWLGTLPELIILNLRANQFHGVIREPRTKLHFPKLRIIDISYNNFIGKLPLKYIQSWNAMTSTSVENFGYLTSLSINFSIYFDYVGKPIFYFPAYFDYVGKPVFNFQSVLSIKGMYRQFDGIQNIIAIINFSNNKFNGEILEVIGSLKGLYALDLSKNSLSGSIPSSLGKLAKLESLDLSQNELSGQIPYELAQLFFLQYFNVSYNHLSGSIPQQNQLSTFESSSFEGNMGLCGIPLPNLCGNSEALKPPLGEDGEQEESSSLFQFCWQVVVIGYGCGFLVGLFMEKIVFPRNAY